MMGMTEAATLTEAIKDSYEERQRLLSAKLRELYGEREWPWIRGTFEDQIVFEVNGKTYRRDYTLSDGGAVEFGEPEEVRVTEDVEPVESEGQLQSDLIPLKEKAVAQDGRINLKIISPGWGASGYYSKEVIKRDIPKVFPIGTHQYVDHQTEAEEAERPEGSLRNLAAVTETVPVWNPKGPEGPGMYAKAKVFEDWRQTVDDIAPYTGISIRAYGKTEDGKAEGKVGRIIKEITAGKSIDFVTLPGRGGKVAELIEAARRQPNPTPAQDPREEQDMDEAEVKRIAEAAVAAATTPLTEKITALETDNKSLKEDNARFREAGLMRRTHDEALRVLKDAALPQVTKDRIAEKLAGDPPVTEAGDLDLTKLGEQAKTLAKNERAYLASATGIGRVVGMGDSDPFAEAVEVKPEERAKDRAARFKELGLSESGAALAATGRG